MTEDAPMPIEAAAAPSPGTPATKDRSQPGPLLAFVERLGLLLLMVAVAILFGVLRPHTFATLANVQAIATSQSVLGVAALALIIPLIGGRFDVSVGANIGFCAVAAAGAMSKHGWALIPALALGTGLGATVGVINGYLVAYLGVNSIIGTLGTSTILGGLVTGYTAGIPISSNLSSTLTDIGTQKVAGVPEIFLVMIVIALITGFVITQTPFGRYLSAVGSNLDAARLTGMPVRRIVMLSFVAAGVLAGLAGVLQIASEGDADPQVGGITLILPALAAAFLGATTWRPGIYNVPGTLVALLFLGMTISGLALVGAQPWVTDAFNGFAVVVAVSLAAVFRRQRAGIADVGG